MVIRVVCRCFYVVFSSMSFVLSRRMVRKAWFLVMVMVRVIMYLMFVMRKEWWLIIMVNSVIMVRKVISVFSVSVLLLLKRVSVMVFMMVGVVMMCS